MDGWTGKMTLLEWSILSVSSICTLGSSTSFFIGNSTTGGGISILNKWIKLLPLGVHNTVIKEVFNNYT